MNPEENVSKEQDRTEAANLQEQFGDGFQDVSLPATRVLIEQGGAREQNEHAPLFYVP